MADIEAEYPGFDWDSLPDLDSVPDVYVVKGKYKRGWISGPDRKYIYSGKDGYAYQFDVQGEHKTVEEANVIADRFRVMESVDTVEVIAQKPEDLVWKHFTRDMIREIKSGKQVFPMYLP